MHFTVSPFLKPNSINLARILLSGRISAILPDMPVGISLKRFTFSVLIRFTIIHPVHDILTARYAQGRETVRPDCKLMLDGVLNMI